MQFHGQLTGAIMKTLKHRFVILLLLTLPLIVPASVADAQDSCTNADYQRGQFFAQQEDWEHAVAAFQDALVEAPTCEPIQQALVNAQRELNAQLLGTQEEETQTQIESLLVRALNFERLGLPEEARMVYIEILELDPEQSEALGGLERTTIPLSHCELTRRQYEAIWGTIKGFLLLALQIAVLIGVIVGIVWNSYLRIKGIWAKPIRIVVQTFKESATDGSFSDLGEALSHHISAQISKGPSGHFLRVREGAGQRRTLTILESADAAIRLLDQLSEALRPPVLTYRVAGIYYKVEQKWGADFRLENAADDTILFNASVKEEGPITPIELLERLAKGIAQRVNLEISQERKEQDPSNPVVMNEYALALADTGQTEAALDVLTTAKTLLPDVGEEGAEGAVLPVPGEPLGLAHLAQVIKWNTELVQATSKGDLAAVRGIALDLASRDARYRQQLMDSPEHNDWVTRN